MGGKWSFEEDEHLKRIVAEHGPKNWRLIADALGTVRTDVQVRTYLHYYHSIIHFTVYSPTLYYYIFIIYLYIFTYYYLVSAKYHVCIHLPTYVVPSPLEQGASSWSSEGWLDS
jgi:hypothetical protein